MQCPHCGNTITSTVQGRPATGALTPRQRSVVDALKRRKGDRKWFTTLQVSAFIGRSKSTTAQILIRLCALGKVEGSYDGHAWTWRLT